MSRRISRSTTVAAAPQEVFDLLADPARHPEIDGSGTVRGARRSQRLGPGSRFGMDMRLGVPYRITNTVVEFDEPRRIAWRHVGRHVWRWTLEPAGEGTSVTEEFDWSTAIVPQAIELAGLHRRNERSIEATLERLRRRFEEPSS